MKGKHRAEREPLASRIERAKWRVRWEVRELRDELARQERAVK